MSEEEHTLNFDEQIFSVKKFIKAKQPPNWEMRFTVASCVMPFLWPISFFQYMLHSFAVPTWRWTDHLVRASTYLFPMLGFAFGIYALSLRVWNPELAKLQIELRLPIILGFVFNVLLLVGNYFICGW